MTTLELLNDLQRRDIQLKCVDGELRVNAPLGAVTPDLRAILLEHKPVLVALLTAEERLNSTPSPCGCPLSPCDGHPQGDAPTVACKDGERDFSGSGHPQGDAPTCKGADPIHVESDISLQCCLCGAEVARYSEEGAAYCQAHWDEHLQSLVKPWLAEEPANPKDVGTSAYHRPVSGMEASPLTSLQEIHALGAQWSRTPPAQLVLDLETTGLNPRTNKVITLAVGTPGNVTIIDLRGYYHTDLAQQQAWREALQQLLQRDRLLWIGHNLKFDWSFLAQQFGVRLKHVYDTMLVEKLLHVGEYASASLQASAARYDITVTKEPRSWFIDLDSRPSEWAAPLPEKQLAYMRQDIEVPYQLHERQREAIVRHGLARVVSLEQQALPAIAAMEVRGVCVDRERWRGILAARHEQKEALERQIKHLLGEALARTHPTQETLFGQTRAPEINLASSQQLMQALHTLGIHLPAVTKEALQGVQQPHKIIPLLIEWKALEKFESAFGENLLRYVTAEGRIHATFDQVGAASGRIICREPNLQQIPRSTANDDPYDLRRCFSAPAGYKLLIADLSNIELRILAEVSGDATMQQFFAEGKDLHSETARLMFKLPPEVDPKVHLVNGKMARDIAKTINFGLAYGMGAQGLANRIGVDLASAKQLMQTYFTTYRAVATYLTRSGQEGVIRGYAKSLSGRKRFFAQEEIKVHRSEVERSAKNHPIQGTNADILKYALALLYRDLSPEVHIVLTIHDEIVLECPHERMKEATQLLKDALKRACRAYLKVVHIPETEVFVSEYWRKE